METTGLSHTHTRANPNTHMQPVHPNSCLVDLGLSGTACRNIYQQEKQLVLVAAVMYAREEGGREGEGERVRAVDRQTDRQHYAWSTLFQLDNTMHLDVWCLFTGCCYKKANVLIKI